MANMLIIGALVAALFWTTLWERPCTAAALAMCVVDGSYGVRDGSMSSYFSSQEARISRAAHVVESLRFSRKASCGATAARANAGQINAVLKKLFRYAAASIPERYWSSAFM